MNGLWRSAVLAVLVVGIPLASFLIWTEASLRPELERRTARQLARTARLMAARAGDLPLDDALADSLGAAARLRVTFVGPNGSVLGDSEVAEEALRSLGSHGRRPEVIEARAHGLGYDRRESRSVSLRLFYVAIPYGGAVIRLAVPAVEVSAALDRIQRTAGFLAGLALVLLLIFHRWLGRAARRGLDEVRRTIRAIGAARYETRARVNGGALGALATELNEAAAAVESRAGRIHERATELERVLDAIDEGVAVCDADGHVVLANREFQRWAGSGAFAGRPIGTLFRPPEPHRVVDAALGGRSTTLEAVLGSRTARLRAVPFGEGALLLVRDLTQTRRLEAMRRDFVANVSHELKTPLTAIRGFTEPLVEGDVEAGRATEFLQRILANVDRMQRLVDDLLDLARIESGGWNPAPRAQEVAAVAERVWGRIEPLADVREIRFEVEVNGAGRASVDPEALEQIIANLLDNAVRYSPEGGTVALRVRPARDPACVRIEVADEGPGIPLEHRDRVFERFYRADAARSRAAGGTGLGLSIVKHLVVAHGGIVGIDGELGEGTTVWFELPVEAAGATL